MHEAGARHIADPSRLMASAARVFGSVLDELFGQLRPTDAERITVLTTASPTSTSATGGGSSPSTPPAMRDTTSACSTR